MVEQSRNQGITPGDWLVAQALLGLSRPAEAIPYLQQALVSALFTKEAEPIGEVLVTTLNTYGKPKDIEEAIPNVRRLSSNGAKLVSQLQEILAARK